MRASQCRCRGFTLLELLIALSIFALLAAATYGGLVSILSQRADVEQRAERLHELQLAYRVVERDLLQFSRRAIRDEYGDTQPAMALGGEIEGLEFTHAGWLNPADRPRPDLQRVRYIADQDRLLRFSWQVLDRAQDSEPVEQPLFDRLRTLEVRLMDESGSWHDQWPPLTVGEEQPKSPWAVEMVMELEDLGEIRWLFRLAV